MIHGVGNLAFADIVCKNWVSWENGLHIGNFHPGNISINHGQPWGTQFSNNPMWQAFRTPQHTTTDNDIYKSYLNIFDHIKWILNHPSINLQFLQKVNHRQPSWLSHRKPPTDRRESRLQRTQPDSQSLETWGNWWESVGKGPFPSPFSDNLMLSFLRLDSVDKIS